MKILIFILQVPLSRKRITRKNNCSQRLLCGNKLDGDRPIRRKGKVRLHQKKYKTRIKRDIILSKQMKNMQPPYSQSMLKLKRWFHLILNNNNDMNVELLVSSLGSLKIDQSCLGNKNIETELHNAEVNDTSKSLLSLDTARSILHSHNFKTYIYIFIYFYWLHGRLAA